MSKRFRPSIRAAKGRVLRPRGQQARLERSGSNPPDSPEVEQVSAETPEPALHDGVSQPEAQPEAAVAAEPSTPPEPAYEVKVVAAPAEIVAPPAAAEIVDVAAPTQPEPALPAPAPEPVAEAAPAPAAEAAPAPAPVAEAAPAPEPVAEAAPAPAPVAEAAPAPAPVAEAAPVPAPAPKQVEVAAPAEDVPASRRAGSAADELSLSAEFFRREEEDSLAPLIEHEHEEEHAPRVELSPKAIARRNRMRRVVAGVVAFAGVISLAVVGKTLAAAKPASQPAPVVQVTRQAAPQIVEKRVEVAPAAPEPKAEAAKAEPKAEAKPEEAEAKPEEKPAEPAKEDVKEAPKAAGDAVALKKEALALLNRGKLKDAIPVAERAIEADPTDALPYLYLGSALQETGKWKAGIEAYSQCVRNATKGPVHECRAMGGRK